MARQKTGDLSLEEPLIRNYLVEEKLATELPEKLYFWDETLRPESPSDLDDCLLNSDASTPQASTPYSSGRAVSPLLPKGGGWRQSLSIAGNSRIQEPG